MPFVPWVVVDTSRILNHCLQEEASGDFRVEFSMPRSYNTIQNTTHIIIFTAVYDKTFMLGLKYSQNKPQTNMT